MERELIIRDIVVIFLILFGIFMGIKFFTSSNNSVSEVKSKNLFININNIEFKSCSEGDNKIKLVVDDLSDIFSGDIYNKPILLCVLDGSTAYCKKSDIIQSDNISIVFFPKSCFEITTQDMGGDKVIIPLTYAENIKNETDVYNLYKEGYIYVESEEIIDGLVSPEKVINKLYPVE